MFVVTIVWMNKAHKTTQRLWRGSRKWTSGWTVGGWFIPFANFVIPKKVLNEIERIATAPRTGGVVGSGWRQESTSALGWLWWIGFSLSIVFRTIGTGLLGDLTGPDDDITAGYTTQAIGSFLTVAAMDAARGGIDEARSTFGWVANVSPDVSAFTERLRYEVAFDNQRQQLDDQQIQVVHKALATHAVATKNSEAWLRPPCRVDR